MPSNSHGIGCENHNGFNIVESGRSRGEKIKSLIWRIEGEMPSEWYSQIDPQGCPIILSFDAEKKTLVVDLTAAKLFAVKVQING
jgi:hypothetical protein